VTGESPIPEAGPAVAPAPPTRNEEGRRRVRRVFAFLRAFAVRRAPDVRTLAEVSRKVRLRELPEHPAIKVGSVTLRGSGRTSAAAAAEEEDDARGAEPLLRVRRPTFTRPPPPPAVIAEWLLRGWDKPDGKVAVWNLRHRRRAGKLTAERFAEDAARPRALAAWSRVWNQWAEAERPAREAMAVFETLYALHSDIGREGERIELVLGDGRLQWRIDEGTTIDHPVLLQRVDLVFDPSVPEFRVVDSDRPPELHANLLLAGGSLSGQKLNELQQELEAGGYHPLAGQETTAFLRRLVSLLGPTGALRKDPDDSGAHGGPTIVRDAVLLARDRAAGFSAAFDRVLEDMDAGGELPPSLTRLVGIEPAPGAPGADEPATPDLLLSKPANHEQIEIVRALERHHAVLVQGPPGTGKSHTIANLVGHLVAHGKRVLVTSYTTKALRVLREQVVEELRPLCVSVLDNDIEGRAQMEQAVRGIVHRLSTSTEERLGAELELLERERARLIEEVERLGHELRTVRQDEYRPIELDGEDVAPAEAARQVEAQADRLGWLPGPLPPAAPVPLDETELGALYASNDEVSSDDERELERRLPERADLLGAVELEGLVEMVESSRRSESARYWRKAPEPGDVEPLEAVQRAAAQLLQAVAALTPWQRQLVSAGRTHGADEDVWRQLGEQVKQAAAIWQDARPLLLEHAPTLSGNLPRAEVAEVLAQIGTRLGEGGGLGGLSLLFRSKWRGVLESCRVGGQPPTVRAHFAALAALTDVERTRAELAGRWARQAEPAGLPPFATLPDPPEPTLLDYVEQFERLLALWSQRWGQIEAQLGALGFHWESFRADEIARASPSAPFESDLAILAGPLKTVLAQRLVAVGRLDALRRLKAAAERLGQWDLAICRILARAINDLDVHAYGREVARLEELWHKAAVLQRRRELLRKLSASAPEWAGAVERRRGMHGALVPPRDLAAAWRWRQMQQELERRAETDDRTLARKLEEHLEHLREVTVKLVDRRAWLAQLRRTGLQARQALIGWADTQRKIGKGTGKRAPALQMRARELLTRAREAVPVWIMPLSRVAESFDPRHGKFDVVIVDEASQCDLGGLLALYLGRGAVIVGDHEQVSPSAIGETVEDTQALISQFLGGIPNSHLYDGQTSVYDLARQSFGGTIGLREHFRCVPDIIEFSNQLSYNGEIRPLRDPGSARRPHTVEYPVPSGLIPERNGKVNDAEARVVAALVASAMSLPEYEGKTFGAISLLGDEQAARIQALIQQLVPLADLERRRFVAGNPAQFQGDERDVVFLSMVDVSEGEGQPLPLQERLSFKQRYNVAASRARDQLWLVHSLDPQRDLQMTDLRRRLIEHVRNPEGTPRGESERRRVQSPFEQEVTEQLRAEGFRVEPQVEVGGYRLDLVVSGKRQQAAIECDGDRLYSPEKIALDMARQVVLERVGWRFVHVRATRFFRDREGAMRAVINELERLGMERLSADEPPADAAAAGENLRNKVIRRAWQLMREHEWLAPTAGPPPVPVDALAAETGPLGAEVDMAIPEEIIVDDTTEPNFVILEQEDG
jgi:very-short-patch-repair endonuclease